jgi:hypothetical protein
MEITMRFLVSIDFKKGTSFGADLQAVDKDHAERLAVALARDCGFDQPVERITATCVDKLAHA